MRTYELESIHDSRKSFYGKARVEVSQTSGDMYLISYSTTVAAIRTINGGEKFATVKGLYSNTTTRHIKEFLKQNGFKAENSKQIMADYGTGGTR